MQGQCANHLDRASAKTCLLCRQRFCEECLAFAVNDSPSCEVCTNRVREECKPKVVTGMLVALAGISVTTCLLIAKALFVPGVMPGFILAIGVMYVGSISAGMWAIERRAGARYR